VRSGSWIKTVAFVKEVLERYEAFMQPTNSQVVKRNSYPAKVNNHPADNDG